MVFAIKSRNIKPVFHLATLFARREVMTRIRHHDWSKLAGEKIRREQVGTVSTFLLQLHIAKHLFLYGLFGRICEQTQ